MRATDPLSFQTWLNLRPKKYAALIEAVGDESVEPNEWAYLQSLARDVLPAETSDGIVAKAMTRWRKWLAKEGGFRGWLLSGHREFVLEARTLATAIRKDQNLPNTLDELSTYVPEIFPGPEKGELTTLWTLFMIHQLGQTKHLSTYSRQFDEKYVHSGYDEILCAPNGDIPEFPGYSEERFAVRISSRLGASVFALPDRESADRFERVALEAVTTSDVIIYTAREIIVNNFIDEMYLVIGEQVS